MQMMVAVFDFPEHDAAGEHEGHVPLLALDLVSGPASAA
jgi:hypothetical protein